MGKATSQGLTPITVPFFVVLWSVVCSPRLARYSVLSTRNSVLNCDFLFFGRLEIQDQRPDPNELSVVFLAQYSALVTQY